MIGFHGSEPPAIAKAYDFFKFEIVVDVGGGTGNLLTEIFKQYPGPRGVLIDRPNVVLERVVPTESAVSVMEANPV